MSAPFDLNAVTCRAVNHLMAEAAWQLEIIRFNRGVDEVNERLAALDSLLNKEANQ